MSERQEEKVAIVGIACRFPGGANDPESFWRLLMAGEDPIGRIPGGRFDVDRFVDPQPGTPGKMVTAEGGFLEGIDRFDAAFFGISPREARKMDPQHRLLMEIAWEALEDAGIPPSSLAGKRVGVFAGVWSSEYESVMYRTPSELDFHSITGGGRYAASGRISFALDLRGPAVTVDTGCSASLVALHLARKAVEDGECELAIAAAANLVLQPHVNVGYSRSGMLSAGARCRFGDAEAAGYVRSDGVAAVVLKPLDRAVADRDPLRGVVLATGVNADGRGSGQLATPSSEAQAEMLDFVYGRAGVDPASVPYVEAHGTGTRAGDPVELEALGQVLGRGRTAETPLIVGSVKSVIGHTEAAAGMAGLIKALLAMEHRTIPANLHLRTPSDAIDWDGLRVRIPTAPITWPAEAPLIAGVSSFGITGTNAHAVVAVPEIPTRADDETEGTGASADAAPQVVVLSGRTATALREATERLREWLVTGCDDARLADIAYTTGSRREHHEHRLALVVSSVDDLLDALDDHLGPNVGGRAITGSVEAAPPRIGFVFSGQGSQWVGMGRELLATAPAFAAALNRCDEEVRSQAGWSVIDVLLDDDPGRLDRVEVIQPVLTCVQIALSEQLRAWGIAPEAVAGHSMGEVAAAFSAGALTLRDAVRVIVTRSRLLATIAGKGAMALVDLTEAEVDRLLEGKRDRVAVAALNGPRTTVISGDPEEIDTILETLDDEGVFGRRVKVDVASHSPQTEPLLGPLREALASLAPRTPSAAFHSTARPGSPTAPLLDAEYWVDNLRRPVGLSTAIRSMVEAGIDTFVEIAPHPVLLTSLADIAADAGSSVRTLAGPRRDESERRNTLQLLARLHVAGAPVRWDLVAAPDARVVPLPHYPWQRERHWLEEWEDWSDEGRATAAERVGASVRPEAAESLVYTVDWAPAAESGGEAGTGASGSPGSASAEPELPGAWLVVRSAPEAERRTGSEASRADRAEVFAAALRRAGREVLLVDGSAALPEALRRVADEDTGVAGVVVDTTGGLGAGQVSYATGADPRGAGSNPTKAAAAVPAEAAGESIREVLRAVVGGSTPGPEPGVNGAAAAQVTDLPTADGGDAVPAATRTIPAAPVISATSHALATIRALVGAGVNAPTWWVTCGAQTLPGRSGSEGSWEQAGVWGIVRTLWQEHPELDGHLVDLDPAAADGIEMPDAPGAQFGEPDPDDANYRAARDLLAAVTVHRDEPQLAFAGGEAFVARLRRAPHEAVGSAVRWPTDGACLITGGLGALGLRVADQLARAGVRRLILMGRTPLPPRREWGDLPAGPVAKRAEAVLSLEARGIAVHLAAVDAGDERALASWLDEYRAERWPAIRGIVHCAGTLDNQLLREMPADALASMMRGKAAAAVNLARLIPEAERTVYFSSTVPVIPQAGQANYAAANAALDALAAARSAAGHPTTSIGWGVWKGEGLVADERVGRYVETMERSGLGSLDPEVASALFPWLAGSSLPHLVVAPIDWSTARSRLENRPGAAFYSELAGAESAPAQMVSFRDQLADSEEAMRPSILIGHVHGLVARILEVAPEMVSPTQPLGRQGLDSLMGLELRNRLEGDLRLRLPASLTWNYPTIERLSAHLLERLTPEFAAAAAETNGTPTLAGTATPAGAAPTGNVEAGELDAQQLVAEVRELSDEEILQQLRAEF